MQGFYTTSTVKRHPVSGWITFIEWLNILAKQKMRCIDCKLRFGLRRVPTVGHRVPVVAGGTNWPANIIAQCGSCNSKQGSTVHA